MYKKIIKLENTEIEESKFHQNETAIWTNDVDINKTVVSNKFPFGKQDFKYIIGNWLLVYAYSVHEWLHVK